MWGQPGGPPVARAQTGAVRGNEQVMSEITGAQSLVRSLEAAGADDIFGIPGGAILPAALENLGGIVFQGLEFQRSILIFGVDNPIPAV